MKPFKALGLIILSIVMFAGCITRNPNYNPQQPPSVSNPQYMPDTNRLATVAAPIQAANAATAAVNPYAPLVDRGIELALLVATAISASVAKSKNTKAANATAAAQHLATVLPDNLVDKAINTAPTPAIAASVASHLASAPDTGTMAIKS